MRYAYTFAASAVALSSLLSCATAYTTDNELYLRYAEPDLDDVYDVIYGRDADADPKFFDDFEGNVIHVRDPGVYARQPIKGGVPDLPKRPKPKFGPKPPTVKVDWAPGQKSNKKKNRAGNEAVEKATAQALEHENRTDPPKSPGGTVSQWNKATLRHGFNSDSTKRTGKEEQGTSGQANALAQADNGYKTTKHIGQDGKVVPKNKDKNDKGKNDKGKNGKRDLYLTMAEMLYRRATDEEFDFIY